MTTITTLTIRPVPAGADYMLGLLIQQDAEEPDDRGNPADEIFAQWQSKWEVDIDTLIRDAGLCWPEATITHEAEWDTSDADEAGKIVKVYKGGELIDEGELVFRMKSEIDPENNPDRKLLREIYSLLQRPLIDIGQDLSDIETLLDAYPPLKTIVR